MSSVGVLMYFCLPYKKWDYHFYLWSECFGSFLDSVRNEGIALLVPPGKDPPPSLGGQIIVGESLNKGERSQQLLTSNISSLINCCCTMLTSFYPVQVYATHIAVTKITHVNVEFCTQFISESSHHFGMLLCCLGHF